MAPYGPHRAPPVRGSRWSSGSGSKACECNPGALSLSKHLKQRALVWRALAETVKFEPAEAGEVVTAPTHAVQCCSYLLSVLSRFVGSC
jgi:hypothetical protein